MDHLNFHAFFLHDTRLVLNAPRPASGGLSADEVGRRLNRLFEEEQAGLPRLEFTWDHRFELSDLDDRQTWVVYKARIDPRFALPSSAPAMDFAESSIWLYENGVVVLTLSVDVVALGSILREGHLVEAVDAVARYLGDDKSLALHVEKEVLGRFGAVLRGARAKFQARLGEEPRERQCLVRHPYPTLLGMIESEDGEVGQLDLAATPLAGTTRLHDSEMTSVLSTSARDYLAVGYDSVWLIQRGPWSEARAEEARERRIRLPTFVALHLALWMQLYTLETELEGLLAQVRRVGGTRKRGTARVKAGNGQDGGDERDVLKSIGTLRGELEAAGRQLSPQRLSTWSDEVRLFAAIRRSWFIEDSLTALRGGLEALHRELVEMEQRRLTFLASVFAGAGVAGMLIAVATLLLTRIDLTLDSGQGTWLGVKVGIIAVAVWLPPLLVSPFLRSWYGRVNGWLRDMPFGRRGPTGKR